MRLNCTLQPAQLLEVRRILWVIVFTTITSVVSLAQVNRAVLEGTVTDPSGAAIVGARSKLVPLVLASSRNSAQTRTAITAFLAYPSADIQ